MSFVFVFPGQAAQAVGMGLALRDSFSAARQVFEEVDDALSERLSRLIFEGPEAELTLTANAQPALMAVSLAALRALEAEAGQPVIRKGLFVAGHSLGEYSALAAAGSLSVATVARLLRVRGLAMQEAVSPEQGAMAAILGLDFEDVVAVAAEASQDKASQDQVCELANDNAPGQVVISGHRQAVERAITLAVERGARRGVMLPVSAPFHCSLMAPVEAVMDEALAAIDLAAPMVPLIANVTAAPVDDPEEIGRLLVEQVTAMVRWRQSVDRMVQEGATGLIEIGAGRVLCGLARRIDRSLAVLSLQEPQDISPILEVLFNDRFGGPVGGHPQARGKGGPLGGHPQESHLTKRTRQSVLGDP